MRGGGVPYVAKYLFVCSRLGNPSREFVWFVWWSRGMESERECYVCAYVVVVVVFCFVDCVHDGVGSVSEACRGGVYGAVSFCVVDVDSVESGCSWVVIVKCVLRVMWLCDLPEFVFVYEFVPIMSCVFCQVVVV